MNQVVNRVRYANDPGDKWLAPADFVRKGGDCEDYAIAKYFLLRKLGVSASSMRIVGLAAQPGMAAHAVLVVGSGSQSLVLDSLRSGVYRLNSGVTSRMVYAVNDARFWINLGSDTAIAGLR